MIKTFSKLLLCLLFSVALTHNHTAFATNKTPASILVLGDSLSGAYGININEGWVALLQQQIINEGYDYRVINASVSGDTTRTGLSRINSALKSHTPEIVIIALGGNDGLRGLAFSEIENSLSSIIESCKKEHVEILLVGVRMPPNYGAVYNKQFTELYHSLAQRYDIPLVPRMLNQVTEHHKLMQQDGMHPKAEAQPQVMINVWTGLKPILDQSTKNN
jgi:acyl-CoA thioesterase I